MAYEPLPNGIIEVRVDDRMVHGIVATMWIPGLNTTRAMVVNEAASNDPMQRNLQRMSIPAGVNMSLLAPAKAAANLNNGNYASQRVYVCGRFISDIYELFKAGVKLPRVNLGNVTQTTGEVTVLDNTVRVNAEEKRMLKEMSDAGIPIVAQFRNDNTPKDLSGLL